jgi:hypothetical protein
MEAARTSETSVDIQLRTRQYIPDDSELHTRRRENLKSHILIGFFRPYIHMLELCQQRADHRHFKTLVVSFLFTHDSITGICM